MAETSTCSKPGSGMVRSCLLSPQYRGTSGDPSSVSLPMQGEELSCAGSTVAPDSGSSSEMSLPGARAPLNLYIGDALGDSSTQTDFVLPIASCASLCGRLA